MMLLEKICLIFNTNFHTLLARCFKGAGNIRITYYLVLLLLELLLVLLLSAIVTAYG